MINLVDEARRSAAELIEKAYLKAVANGALPQAEIKKPVIEEPKDIRNGDLACSFAMQNVKIIGRPPRVIADAVIANMEFESCDAPAERINEAFADNFGDVILEDDGTSGFVIIEDYLEDVIEWLK